MLLAVVGFCNDVTVVKEAGQVITESRTVRPVVAN